jgi:hypothetical protein
MASPAQRLPVVVRSQIKCASVPILTRYFDSMRTIFKFVLPLMCTFMVMGLLWGNDRKSWAVLPILLILLYLGAAELRVEGKHILYRRFFSWKELPDDVSDMRCTILPALGYVRFRRFMPPLGVLFFIVERDSGRFVPFQRTASMQRMLSAPHLRQDGVTPPLDNHIKEGKANGKSRLVWVLSSTAGLVAGILIPVPWQRWASTMDGSPLSRFLLIQQHPAILCLYALLLVALVIQDRFRSPASFGLAFVIGTVVSHLSHVH